MMRVGGSAHERFWISCCLVLRFTVGEGCLLSLRLERECQERPPHTHTSHVRRIQCTPQERVQTQIEQGWKVERPDCSFRWFSADKSQGTESGEIHPSNFRDADTTANHGTVSALSYPSYSSLSPAMTHGSYPLYLLTLARSAKAEIAPLIDQSSPIADDNVSPEGSFPSGCQGRDHSFFH
jgi:hypothetical protein